MFTIGVFAVIKNEHDKVLLCRRNDIDLWNLPGGRVESGECLWDALKREVKEEVCLDVEIDRLTGVYSKTNVDDLVLVCECRIISGEPGVSDEAREVAFFDFHEIPTNTNPNHVDRIAHALFDSHAKFEKSNYCGGSKKYIEEGILGKLVQEAKNQWK